MWCGMFVLLLGLGSISWVLGRLYGSGLNEGMIEEEIMSVH